MARHFYGVGVTVGLHYRHVRNSGRNVTGLAGVIGGAETGRTLYPTGAVIVD
jgi:hypothetical protein